MILNQDEIELEQRDCYGKLKTITLSWSRLSDWFVCKQRVKLYHTGGRSSTVNTRNFLCGKVVDLVMRETLDNASRDSSGRIQSIDRDDMMGRLPDVWERCLVPEEGRLLKWNGTDVKVDQKKILNQAKAATSSLHPILVDKVVGRRVIPEFRPATMPAFGIPLPDGGTGYIRLFLGIDLLIQEEEDGDRLGEWGIWDLKATAYDSYIPKTLWQLVFYDLAYQALTGKYAKTHGLITPLLDKKIHSIVVDDEHRDQMASWIVQYCHSVWAGEEDFVSPDKEKEACFGCPTRNACPKIVHPLTKDEQGLTWARFDTKRPGLMKR